VSSLHHLVTTAAQSRKPERAVRLLSGFAPAHIEGTELPVRSKWTTPMPTRSLPSRRPTVLAWRLALTALFCLLLALAPSLAEARAGKSFSFGGSSGLSGMGSRGSRTFEQNGAAPIARSMTPQSPSMLPGAASSYGGSFFQQHPFLTGLAGGFLGSLLFHSLGGFGMALGGLMTMAILGLLIWIVVRLFAGGWMAGGRSMGMMMPRSVGAAAAPIGSAATRYRGRDITVNDNDLNAFQVIHANVQDAWGHGDLGRLRQLMTPEMLSYFSEELTRNASQGVQNVVSNVRLLQGDISEAWEEGDLQYATAYLRWSAIDHVLRLGHGPTAPDAVIGGDARTPVEQEEVWTFVRRPGGNWLLSAIQQV
jgi:hypothetical protein